MRTIILLSHGTMAEGVYEAASMICGELANVRYLCLKREMGIELFRQQLRELVEEIAQSDEIIALADLQGGSPYTSMVTLLSEEGLLGKSKVISGLSLPLVLTVYFAENDLGGGKLAEVIQTAKDGIAVFEVQDEEDDTL